MSSYATLDDLKDELGVWYARLTDRVDAEVADDDTGASILVDAESEMNKHLGTRYAVPVDASSSVALAEILKSNTLRIAAHVAWLKSLLRKTEPRDTKRLHDEVILWLKDVANGKEPLPDVVPLTSSPTGVKSVSGGDPAVWTPQAMEGI